MPRKTGSLASETPRLPGQSAVSSPPTAVRPAIKPIGQVLPRKPNKAAEARTLAVTRALLLACFLSGPLL